MLLEFKKPFKSIRDLCHIELPNFAIITGVNGAGKSHLLEAIEHGAIQVDGLVQNEIEKPIRRYDWATLVPADTSDFAPYQITQEQHQIWMELSGHSSQLQPQFETQLLSLNLPTLLRLSKSQIARLTATDLVSEGCSSENAPHILIQLQQILRTDDQQTTQRFIGQDRMNRPRLLQSLRRDDNELLTSLTEADFYTRFPRNWQPVDIFQQSFARLFAGYQREWLNNSLARLEHEEDESVQFLTEEEFKRQHGEPPWEFVNRVLETAGLDFRINRPERHRDVPYSAVLKDQVTGAEVKFANLSSGEKVLMSFAFCLYYAYDPRQKVNYPKVLLFDEIDAPLHPSMTRSLLNTIEEVLVGKLGIRVLFATHSSSTVALAPNESLHAMTKVTPRIGKITKDGALALLTAGVPTLSIDYENRRQVFVESFRDAACYELLFNILRSRLIPEISLSFIASGGAGRGNCAQVRDVVDQLHRGGSRSVYGIVDWDLVNVGNERVKIVGGGIRYSIENYILDPLLMAAFLLREKIVKRADLGLSADENYLSVATFTAARLQAAADYLIDQLAIVENGVREGEHIACQYVGGASVVLDKGYLCLEGHKLEEAWKSAFPKLNGYRDNKGFCFAVLARVADEVPALISSAFLQTFQEIQT